MSKRREREPTPIEKQVREIAKRRERFAIIVAFSELALELEKTDQMIEDMDDSPEKTVSTIQQEEAWKLLLGGDMFGNIVIEA